MPPVLPINKQGFPAVLKNLGVIQPLQGPFWGFDPTIMPVFVVGDVSTKQNAGMPYFTGDFNTNVTVDPGTLAVLAVTPQLVSGRYGLEFDYVWFVGAANGSLLTYSVVDGGGSVVRDFTFDIMGPTGTPRDRGANQLFFVEDLNDGDKIAIINSSAILASSFVRSTIKWIRLEALSFKEP